MAVDYDLRSVMFAQAVFRECQKTKKGGRPDMNKVIVRFGAHPLNSASLTLTRTEAAQLFAKVFPKRPSLKALEKATLDLTSVYIQQQAELLGRKRQAEEFQDVKTMDRLHQIAKSARLSPAGSRQRAGGAAAGDTAKEDAGEDASDVKTEAEDADAEVDAEGDAEEDAEAEAEDEAAKDEAEGEAAKDEAAEDEAAEDEVEAEAEAEAEVSAEDVKVEPSAQPESDEKETNSEDEETFRQRSTQILKELQVRKPVRLFARPDTTEDYTRIVLAPTDLRTIRNSIKEGTISNSKDLQQELLRMFANAVMANPWDSVSSVRARDIAADFEEKHLL